MNLLIIALAAVMYLLNLAVTLLNDRHSRKPIPAQAQGIYDDKQYAK